MVASSDSTKNAGGPDPYRFLPRGTQYIDDGTKRTGSGPPGAFRRVGRGHDSTLKSFRRETQKHDEGDRCFSPRAGHLHDNQLFSALLPSA